MKTSTPCFAINAASVIFVTIPPVVSCAAIENSTVSRQMNQCLILYLFTVLFKIFFTTLNTLKKETYVEVELC